MIDIYALTCYGFSKQRCIQRTSILRPSPLSVCRLQRYGYLFWIAFCKHPRDSVSTLPCCPHCSIIAMFIATVLFCSSVRDANRSSRAFQQVVFAQVVLSRGQFGGRSFAGMSPFWNNSKTISKILVEVYLPSENPRAFLKVNIFSFFIYLFFSVNLHDCLHRNRLLLNCSAFRALKIFSFLWDVFTGIICCPRHRSRHWCRLRR